MKKLNHSSGFTLVEIMIAVLILSIGLLGMAGIQLQGLKGSKSSTLRSQASILANDIAERANANPAGAFGNAAQNQRYSNFSTGTINDDGSITPSFNCNAAPPFKCSAVHGEGDTGKPIQCTPTQMAQYDAHVWACGINGNGGISDLLPGGVGTVTCNGPANDCPEGATLTVTISWLDSDANFANAQRNSISIDVHPTPYVESGP